jgi:hypothetical protein
MRHLTIANIHRLRKAFAHIPVQNRDPGCLKTTARTIPTIFFLCGSNPGKRRKKKTPIAVTEHATCKTHQACETSIFPEALIPLERAQQRRSVCDAFDDS